MKSLFLYVEYKIFLIHTTRGKISGEKNIRSISPCPLCVYDRNTTFFSFAFHDDWTDNFGRVILETTHACARIKLVVKKGKKIRVDKQLVGEHHVVDTSNEMFLGMFPQIFLPPFLLSRLLEKCFCEIVFLFSLKSEALTHKYHRDARRRADIPGRVS